MPSDLCLCMTVVGSWWGITLATIFWKPCLGVEEPYNIQQDIEYPYKDFKTNNKLFTIDDSDDSDDSDYEPLIDPRSKKKKNNDDESYDMIDDNLFFIR